MRSSRKIVIKLYRVAIVGLLREGQGSAVRLWIRRVILVRLLQLGPISVTCPCTIGCHDVEG